jgi:hypothetical protein
VPTASATNRGALSSSDWSTFNSKQVQLNGTGFVKASGTTISYDNTNYLPLTGGTMTGPITTPNGTFGIVIGDDSRLADRNVANTLFIEGNQNSDRGYINFSETGGNVLGAINGGDLTWKGAIVLQVNNYNFFAPTLTGGGASGTWGIDITGNAGTVTNGVYTSRTITINGTTQDLSANRTFNVGTVTSVTASSPLFSSGGTTPNITIQQASGSQNGFLSSTDWTTFNNKQNALTNPVTGTGVSGRVAFWNGTNTITSDSDLLFSGTTLTLLAGNVEIAAGNGLILFNPATTNYFQLYTNSSNDLNFGFGGTNPRMTITSSGRLLIGNAPPAESIFSLDVNGGARFTNSTRVEGSFVIQETNTPQQSILLNAIPTNANTTGILRFGARWNSTTYGTGAEIRASAVGTWSSTNYGTNLTFATVAQNSDVLNTRMTINSTGNVGIGVTPSGWATIGNTRALQLGTISSFYEAFEGTNIGNNTFYDGSADRYLTTGRTSSYLQFNGEHIWYNATSGTAGNSFTWVERMRITSGGNVLIGTSTSGSSKLRLVGLPTSAVGLSSGDVYNLSGVLMIA